MDSATRSRAFYRALGPAGLAIRTKPEWDARIVETVVGLLPAAGRVLDVGCGYGRIAIPLAERGYSVTGIDIAPNLLRAARREARRRGVDVAFDAGSMTSLPYANGSFDAVICLWSAYYELLQETEQVETLREMARVLRPSGTAVIEGPTFEPPAEDRLRTAIIGGNPNQTFAHNRASLERVSELAGIADRRVELQVWAGRERQILLFHG